MWIIKIIYSIDKRTGVDRKLKITEEHVFEHKIKKMRAKHISQVFSNSVSEYIKSGIRKIFNSFIFLSY